MNKSFIIFSILLLIAIITGTIIFSRIEAQKAEKILITPAPSAPATLTPSPEPSPTPVVENSLDLSLPPTPMAKPSINIRGGEFEDD